MDSLIFKWNYDLRTKTIVFKVLIYNSKFAGPPLLICAPATAIGWDQQDGWLHPSLKKRLDQWESGYRDFMPVINNFMPW